MSGERGLLPTCGVAFGTPAPMSVGCRAMAQVTYVHRFKRRRPWPASLDGARHRLGGGLARFSLSFSASSLASKFRARQRVTAWRSPASWMCRRHTLLFIILFAAERTPRRILGTSESLQRRSRLLQFGSTGPLEDEHDVATASSRARAYSRTSKLRRYSPPRTCPRLK